MVAMATSMGRKKYTCQKNIIWTSGYHLLSLWKEYQNFEVFFLQNLEDIFGVVHQRMKDGIHWLVPWLVSLFARKLNGHSDWSVS